VPEPLVEVSPAGGVDVCPARKDGRLIVHLVNTSGPHRTQSIQESVPPVGPLTLTIRAPARPSRVTREPAGQTLPFEYAGGRVRLTVPRVEVHEAVVLTP
jgi:hypothetical protein